MFGCIYSSLTLLLPTQIPSFIPIQVHIVPLNGACSPSLPEAVGMSWSGRERGRKGPTYTPAASHASPHAAQPLPSSAAPQAYTTLPSSSSRPFQSSFPGTQDVVSVPEELSQSFLHQRLYTHLSDLDNLTKQLNAKLLDANSNRQNVSTTQESLMTNEYVESSRNAAQSAIRGGSELRAGRGVFHQSDSDNVPERYDWDDRPLESEWQAAGASNGIVDKGGARPGAFDYFHQGENEEDAHPNREQQRMDMQSPSFCISTPSTSEAGSPHNHYHHHHHADREERSSGVEQSQDERLPSTSRNFVSAANSETATNTFAPSKIDSFAGHTRAPSMMRTTEHDVALDEIHRRAQELLRSRPVFRPDVIHMVTARYTLFYSGVPA